MEEKTNITSEQTAEQLRQFHERSGRQPKEPVHSDKVLAICAFIIIVGGTLGSFITFEGIECAAGAFASFTTGVYLYTVARIYTTLREIRDNQE